MTDDERLEQRRKTVIADAWIVFWVMLVFNMFTGLFVVVPVWIFYPEDRIVVTIAMSIAAVAMAAFLAKGIYDNRYPKDKRDG